MEFIDQIKLLYSSQNIVQSLLKHITQQLIFLGTWSKCYFSVSFTQQSLLKYCKGPPRLPHPPPPQKNTKEIIISGHKNNIIKPSLPFLAVGHT